MRKTFNRSCYFILVLVLILIADLLLSPAVCFAGPDSFGKIPFQSGDDLAQIQSKIAANGYDFKVSSNWVVELIRPVRERMRMHRQRSGMVRNSTRNFDPGPLQLYLDHSLPEHFDLRNIGSGRSYIGPVRHQGSCGACYAFGACAAAEGTYNLATGRYNQNCADFSEAYITFCLEANYQGFSGCAGSNYDYEELDALVEKGVCSEDLLPYNPFSPGCTADFDPPTVRFISWHRIPCQDIRAIKAAIHHFGVVAAAILTSTAFDAYDSGIYEDTDNSCATSDGEPCYYTKTDHIVALVGWDDNHGDGYWILRNSWGQEWGEEGYMRIKYTSARVSCAVCYLVFFPEAPPVSVWPAKYSPKVLYPCLQLLLSD